jgi:hypothetical protein
MQRDEVNYGWGILIEFGSVLLAIGVVIAGVGWLFGHVSITIQ